MQLTQQYIESTFKNVFQVERGTLDHLLPYCTKIGHNYVGDKCNWEAYILDINTVVIRGNEKTFGQKLNKLFLQAYDEKIDWISQDTLLDTKIESINYVIKDFTFIVNNVIKYRVD